MRYEEIRGVLIPKVGFGTWNIGGGMSADPSRDDESLSALRSAIELGYVHFDTAESYADGHCEELLGRAIKDAGVDRRGLFLASKARASNLAAEQIVRACERSLRRLGTEYLDLYMIHWPSTSIPLGETFDGLNALVTAGKVKYIGVSNFDLEQLQRAQALAASPILSNQVPYSVGDRSCARNGVLSHCQASDILVTAYSPLKQEGGHHNHALAEIAAKRSITLSQAAIAWLCSQPRVITIPMSTDPGHQRANLDAAEIVFGRDEMAALPV